MITINDIVEIELYCNRFMCISDLNFDLEKDALKSLHKYIEPIKINPIAKSARVLRNVGKLTIIENIV
jgi:hypothetical protein